MAAVIGLAAVLRLRSIGWGLPELSEEATPFRKAVGFWGIDTGRLTLDPHFFNYPSLTFYFHFLLQVIWWFGGLVTGAWHSLDQFRTALSTHPAPFILLARRAGALVAAATVAPVYLAGRKLAGVAGGIAAALLLAFSPLHVAESRYIGTDIPLAFCVAMALYFFIGLSTRPAEPAASERSGIIAAGVWTGLAASCKYPGAILLVPLGAVLLWPRGSTAAERPARLHSLRDALLAAAVAFAVTSPFVILDLPEALKSIAFERHHMMFGHFGAPRGLAIFRYASPLLPYALGWPGLGLAVLGVVWLGIRRGPGRLVALHAVAALALIGTWRVAADRYLLLVLPALVIAAGAALAWLAAAGAGRLKLSHRIVAPAAAALALLIAAPGISTAWRESTVRALPSTRAAAEQWVRRNVPPKTLIAAENYSVEALADSLPLLVIPFDAVHPHVYDPAYSLPYYSPFEYVVLSSQMYDRYLSRPADFPAQAAFYDGIARDYDQVRLFEPGHGMTGPTVRVFRRKAGVVRNDLRNIGGAFYDQVAAKQPIAHFLTSLAAVLSKGGRDDLALAAAEQAVALAPDDARNLVNLATLRADRGDYLTALKTYARALDISPRDPILHYNMGRLYEGKDLYDQAVASFVHAIEYNPRFPEPYISLAICQVHLHQYAAARATLRRFLELFPNHPQAGQARRTLEELK